MRGPNRILRIFIRHSLPLVFVAVLLGTGATFLTRTSLRKSSIEQANQTLNQASAYYDVILDEMDSLSLMFSTNPEMMARLQHILEEETMDLDYYREIKLIRSFLSAPANARPYIDSIYVYLENNQKKVLSSNLGFMDLSLLEDSSWFSTYKNQSGNLKSSSEHVILRKGTATEQGIIRIFRPITNFTGSPLGVIVLDFKENILAQSYGQFLTQKGEYLNVKNAEGELLFSNPAGSYPYPDDTMQFFTMRSRKYGWEYTLGIYEPMLYELSTTLMGYTITLSFLALLIGLFLTHRTNRQERKFLANVMQQLNQVGNSHIEEMNPSKYKNIFDYLNYHVIKTFIEQDYLRWQKEAMEYRALQMQINPHFLFNTLDTINWKAIKLAEGDNDVSKMIQLLSKFLQYCLQVEDLQGVPLSKELEQTNYYVQLQQIRFKNSFVYTQDIEDSLLDILVPGMLLQPILENSFNHGFIDGKILNISLSVCKEGEKARITIANDGKPLQEAEVNKLNKEKIDVLKKKSSLGLLNIRKRLMLFSQGKSPMVVSSDGIQGVTITILLPCKKA
jgi:two-component system sensor histidine kinase YesM